ncbi:hypothetical protein COU76_04230 [Candidatus Peregrinibacteria bacterium CG10_big_fil_rev_8_21_14_0_10_49_10]|nr:MAG: hypothetical protein COU76_04230 [Candidatus Peregrinibacteria bacterium CG10_big_fil_rev_8_21_14_0_10_49_10]
MMRTFIRIGSALLACTAVLLLLPVISAGAATTGPQKIIYDAHLLDSSDNAVTTAHSVRFSWWTSADFVDGDVTATGSIDVGAAEYASWQEVHTVTPDSNGYFTVELGSGTALPDLSSYTTAQLGSLFLQVEVKSSGDANTAYELLDQNSTDDTVDRSPIDVVPFALNADLLDQRDTGTSSGSIPVLGSGGLLGEGLIPSGTNRNEFVLDADDSAGDSIALQFGTSLSKKITYDITNGRFNFNDDARIQGNLTVTGLINGVDITSLTEAAGTQLKVSSGAGLTVSIAGGSYRVNSAITNYDGSGSVNLSDQATNYLFFTSTGLTIGSAFPTDKSFIPLASVTATGGSITSVADLRVLSSDDREHAVQQVFQPEYANTTFQGDATNNVGQLYAEHDNTSKNNYYLWTSSITSLQDYDVIVRIAVPVDYIRWARNPLSITYRSTSADTTNNKMDISVFDTNGSPVTLSGSTTELANTSWTTSNIAFEGTPTWTPEQDFLIKFKLYAKDDFQMHLGALKMKHVELLQSP